MLDNLTEEQITGYREIFVLFDKDKDGRLSVDELFNAVKSINNSSTDMEIQDMLNEFDDNSNGTQGMIDFRLFVGVAYRFRILPETTEEIIEQLRAFDKLGTGQITIEDLRSGLRNLKGNVSNEEIEAVLKKVKKQTKIFNRFKLF